MSKPFIYAPAMNTDMWNHPITAKQLRVLDEFGYKMVPLSKRSWLAEWSVSSAAVCLDTVHVLYSQLPKI